MYCVLKISKTWCAFFQDIHFKTYETVKNVHWCIWLNTISSTLQERKLIDFIYSEKLTFLLCGVRITLLSAEAVIQLGVTRVAICVLFHT